MEKTSAASSRVFLVEDSDPIRERLVSLLATIDGIAVVGEAVSPKRAIEGILLTCPDSVVLDIELVGGSGIEVLRAVHAQAPDIRFIILSNHVDMQYRLVCMRAGASCFLNKSTEFARVPEIVSEFGARTHRRQAA